VASSSNISISETSSIVDDVLILKSMIDKGLARSYDGITKRLSCANKKDI